MQKLLWFNAKNVGEIPTWCQFHQYFTNSFFVWTLFCTAFMCLQFEFVNFRQKDFGAKAAHKMLVILTPGGYKQVQIPSLSHAFCIVLRQCKWIFTWVFPSRWHGRENRTHRSPRGRCDRLFRTRLTSGSETWKQRQKHVIFLVTVAPTKPATFVLGKPFSTLDLAVKACQAQTR